MPKKCPPGVICIENMTLVFIVSFVLLVSYFGYNRLINYTQNSNRSLSNNIAYNLNVETRDSTKNQSNTGLYPQPGYSYSNIENDVLLNPYQAPLRDNSRFPNNNNNNNSFTKKMPINVATQSYDTNYRQIGILTRNSGDKETIIPLMGRPLIANRDKWNFYTMSENNNMLKLPVSLLKNKAKTSCQSNTYTKCMGQNGCDDLYTGDIVHVDGYNDSFKVTTYENNAPQYIPYI